MGSGGIQVVREVTVGRGACYAGVILRAQAKGKFVFGDEPFWLRRIAAGSEYNSGGVVGSAIRTW